MEYVSTKILKIQVFLDIRNRFPCRAASVVSFLELVEIFVTLIFLLSTSFNSIELFA